MTNVDKFIDMVRHSDNIVFFGGAGVSTESGIPDSGSLHSTALCCFNSGNCILYHQTILRCKSNVFCRF